MPEMDISKKLSRWSLEEARQVGHVLVIRCGLCNITRRFLPSDILQLRKNTTLNRLRFVCQECNKSSYIDVNVYYPSAGDIGRLPIRRLVGMRDVRMPVWRDETL
ncbi:hypothetical protein HFN76_12480 [Rhizobium laguerreae]|uniref:hypothetical protein n=1 Tax=Rhizobium laguerreae TaxID=1076926 RepID=UPI001C919FB8|nr:hypothetical protein [Rhizobium laguerreae]MBY3513046.1 hypothetical protein [Rhizobium laguerreae]